MGKAEGEKVGSLGKHGADMSTVWNVWSTAGTLERREKLTGSEPACQQEGIINEGDVVLARSSDQPALQTHTQGLGQPPHTAWRGGSGPGVPTLRRPQVAGCPLLRS